jgi:hypothetical protein
MLTAHREPYFNCHLSVTTNPIMSTALCQSLVGALSPCQYEHRTCQMLKHGQKASIIIVCPPITWGCVKKPGWRSRKGMFRRAHQAQQHGKTNTTTQQCQPHPSSKDDTEKRITLLQASVLPGCSDTNPPSLPPPPLSHSCPSLST